MSKTIISAHEHVGNFSAGKTPAFARWYCDTPFTNDDDQTVGSGSIKSAHYAKQQAVTYSAGVTQIPSWTGANRIDSSIDALNGRIYGRYILTLHDAKGVYLTTVAENLAIPATPTTNNVPDLILLSQAARLPFRANYYDAGQITLLLAGLSLAALATDVLAGKVFLDVIPASLSLPTAVGINSPRLTKVLSMDYGNSFTTAISEIGADEITLIVKADVNVSAAHIIPATLILRQENGALITESGTGTIQFQGIGVENPLSPVPFFSGFEAGDVTWTGTVYPKSVSTELFDTGNTSLTDRIKILDEAFDGKYATFICYPRTITGNCFAGTSMNDGHSLYFTKGDYQNTANTAATTELPPFVLGSYSRFSSEPGAKIYESSVALNTYIVQSKIGATQVYIEHNYFVGQGTTFDSFSSTSILSSATDSHIRHNIFENCQAYHAGIVRQGEFANNRNCSITHNICKGFMSQLIYITSGIGCTIAHNTIDLEDATGLNAFSAIDIEPNSKTDYIEDLLVENNLVNVRGIDQGAEGIFIQGAATVNLKNVTCCKNRIIGGDTGVGSQLVTGIDIFGVDGLKVYDNEVIASYSLPYQVQSCNNVVFKNNDARKCGDVRSNNSALYVIAVRDGQFISNTFDRNTSPTFATEIFEAEQEKTVTSSGSTVTATVENPRFYDFWASLIVTLNNTDYTVSAVDTEALNQTLTTSVAVGTLAVKTFLPAAVNTGTNVINIPAHGHITGSRMRLTNTLSDPPAHTAPTVSSITGLSTYFAIRDDDDNIRLANSLANALAGTAIDLTDQGTGVNSLTPVLVTKFSNSTYKDNDAADITLEATAAQDRILSRYSDVFADKQDLDADLTAIAALTPSNDDFMQRKAGAWANRTVAQIKTDLGLTGTNSGDQTALTVPNTPAGGIAATTVQAAIDELDTEKAPKASPTLTGTPAIAAATGTSLLTTGLIKSSGTAGIGYAAGAGGAQTQGTSKSTAVVSNTITTAITMHDASLAADTSVSFTFTNSTIAATDTVLVTHESAGTSAAYNCNAFPGAGSAVITVNNISAGALAEAIVLRVTVLKSVSS